MMTELKLPLRVGGLIGSQADMDKLKRVRSAMTKRWRWALILSFISTVEWAVLNLSAIVIGPFDNIILNFLVVVMLFSLVQYGLQRHALGKFEIPTKAMAHRLDIWATFKIPAEHMSKVSHTRRFTQYDCDAIYHWADNFTQDESTELTKGQ